MYKTILNESAFEEQSSVYVNRTFANALFDSKVEEDILVDSNVTAQIRPVSVSEYLERQSNEFFDRLS